MTKAPKFYPNFDNNHCLQACCMMLLNSYFLPVSWKEIDHLTQYDPKLYTWTLYGVSALVSKVDPNKLFFYTGLDLKSFSNDGESYLAEYWSTKWYRLQKAHASPRFIKEQLVAKLIVDHNLFVQKRILSDDLDNFLRKGVVIALVSVGILYNEPGTSAHFVLLYNSTDTTYVLHDPGLPAKESINVDKRQFMKAFREDAIVVQIS